MAFGRQLLNHIAHIVEHHIDCVVLPFGKGFLTVLGNALRIRFFALKSLDLLVKSILLKYSALTLQLVFDSS
jgi:hypothetical protein